MEDPANSDHRELRGMQIEKAGTDYHPHMTTNWGLRRHTVALSPGIICTLELGNACKSN